MNQTLHMKTYDKLTLYAFSYSEILYRRIKIRRLQTITVLQICMKFEPEEDHRMHTIRKKTYKLLQTIFL